MVSVNERPREVRKQLLEQLTKPNSTDVVACSIDHWQKITTNLSTEHSLWLSAGGIATLRYSDAMENLTVIC